MTTQTATQIQTIDVDERLLMRCLRTAKAQGMPRDQIERFLTCGYVPQPKQMKFHVAARMVDEPGAPEWIGFGGSRGGAKSHACMAQIGLDDCQRRPGLKFLFIRKLQKAAAESLRDLLRRVFYGIDHEYIANPGMVRFPNGSLIVVGGFKDASDIEKYIGIEYDGIAIEELNQLPEDRVEQLRGSMRTSREDWRPRLYATFNPGGVGHMFVKTRFVDPFRRGDRDSKTIFIPSSYQDNRFLDAGYVKWLTELSGDLGRAWRDGDFDVFQGQAFPSWRHEAHVIQPFDIPANWPRWRAIDWGYSNPFCCLWLTKDVDSGRIYVYRELYARELTDRQQARMIRELTPPQEYITMTYADPAMWARKTAADLVTSSAQEYLTEGVPLTQADNDRIGGKRKLDRMLANLPDGKPGIQVFSNCINLIRTLPSIPRDERNGEDVDTDAEDHAYDTLRYGLTNTQIMGENKQSKAKPNPWTQVGNHF